jgi:multidrug efflux pump subunit AcrB
VAAVLNDKAVAGLTSYIGTDNGTALSVGFMQVNLKPLDQRPPIGQVIGRLRGELAKVEGIRVFFTPYQDLNVGAQSSSSRSSSRYQYTLSGSNPAEVERWAEIMHRRIVRMADITDVIGSDETSGLQAGMEIDRTRAASLGITPTAIDNTLYDAFGQRQILTIYLPSNYSRVILEVDPAAQGDPSVFDQVYVPGAKGQVPLTTLMRPRRAHAAMWIRHDDQFSASTISFDMKPGKFIGDGIAAIRAAEATVHLPDDIKAEFKGEAGEANKSGNQQMLFLGAIFAVYVVLGILYESYAHPFTILSTLPSALFGALRGTGSEFTLISAIACVLLVGMVMKNAIMMVVFALDAQRREGIGATPPGCGFARSS